MTSLIRESLKNLSHNSLIDMLPKNAPWLFAAALVIIFGRPAAAKSMLNLVVGKVLFELYSILLKDLHSADLLDLAFPHTTIFDRQILVEGLFCLVFSAAVHQLLSTAPLHPSTADHLLAAKNRSRDTGLTQDFAAVEQLCQKAGLLAAVNN